MFKGRKINGSQTRRGNQTINKKSLGLGSKTKVSSRKAAYDSASSISPLMEMQPLAPVPIYESLGRESKEGGGALAVEVFEEEEVQLPQDVSLSSMSSLTADDPPQQLCHGISNKQSFFYPNAHGLLFSALSVVWRDALKLWYSSKCPHMIPQGGNRKRCAECSIIKKRWRELLQSYNRSASSPGVESSSGDTSAKLLSRLKVVLSRLMGGNRATIHLEAKALVCRTSFAGEKIPKAILINEVDDTKVTLCPNRGDANMSSIDSCEGFVVYAYKKDVNFCDVCKMNVKKRKRVSSSSSSSDKSGPAPTTRNDCLSQAEALEKIKLQSTELKKARDAVNRY